MTSTFDFLYTPPSNPVLGITQYPFYLESSFSQCIIKVCNFVKYFVIQPSPRSRFAVSEYTQHNKRSSHQHTAIPVQVTVAAVHYMNSLYKP